MCNIKAHLAPDLHQCRGLRGSMAIGLGSWIIHSTSHLEYLRRSDDILLYNNHPKLQDVSICKVNDSVFVVSLQFTQLSRSLEFVP